MGRFKAILGCLVFLGLSSAAQAGETHLLWKERPLLEEEGISFNVISVEDFVSNVKGGQQTKSTWLGVLDMDMSVDTGKAGLWAGGQFYVRGVNVHGHKKPSGELVGDLQGVDGNESPRISRLQELWYQHSWQEDRLTLLGGVHDMNFEFAVSENGWLYMNSGFGLTPSIANNVAVPTYPYPALGVRVLFTLREGLSLRTGVYDGDPGDSTDHPGGPDFSWNGKGGTFVVSEAAFDYRIPWGRAGLPGTCKAGFWFHSRDIDDVSSVDDNGDPVRHRNDYGAYGIIDQMLWQEAEGQGLSAFLMGGGAPEDRNTVALHAAGGLNYTGLIPGRNQDRSGIAVTHASISGKKRKAEDLDEAETTVEGTYRIVFNDNVAVQPDIQYVMSPSADPALKNATVVMLRMEIVY
ncbi:MAG: carbohydrate porin [Candidatus Omnitrophota bacterium]|nr:carbohydrate porin [Candidatus Omnitrophota bacterium]MDZ4242670.1 carbohydrate porin [Candidatus Omnitrophota bacterium]